VSAAYLTSSALSSPQLRAEKLDFH